MLSNSQIDKIGEKLKKGDIDRDTLFQLNSFRRSCLPIYTEVNFTCQFLLSVEPSGRAQKSTAAIIGKLRREKVRLSQMQDISGLRVIVPGLFEQDDLALRARQYISNVHVDDRRQCPSHGYRALHLICEKDRRFVELQIRTRSQHAWAELSEKFSDEFGQELKYGGGAAELQEFLMRLSVLGWRLDVVRRDYRLHIEESLGALDRREFKRKRKALESEEGKVLTEIRQLFVEGRRRAARTDH